jgi:hypothetical protein
MWLFFQQDSAVPSRATAIFSVWTGTFRLALLGINLPPSFHNLLLTVFLARCEPRSWSICSDLLNHRKNGVKLDAIQGGVKSSESAHQSVSRWMSACARWCECREWEAVGQLLDGAVSCERRERSSATPIAMHVHTTST